MKKQVIKKFQALMKRLNAGYLDKDYQIIMHMIEFIDACHKLDHPNKIYEKLMVK